MVKRPAESDITVFPSRATPSADTSCTTAPASGSREMLSRTTPLTAPAEAGCVLGVCAAEGGGRSAGRKYSGMAKRSRMWRVARLGGGGDKHTTRYRGYV